MKRLLLFVPILFLVAACDGKAPAEAITPVASTPTTTPAVTTATCYTPTHPFDEDGLSINEWELWDGSQRDFTNSLGSTFSLKIEGNELVAWLDPLNPDVEPGEIGRFPLTPETYVAIPMATDIDSEPGHLVMLIAGPIMISTCSNGQVWISDEHAANEVILSIYDLRDGLYPPQWFGDSA